MKLLSEKIRDGKALVVAVVVAALIFGGILGWRTYANLQRDRNTCAQVEQLRMNIRDFLTQQTDTPPELVGKYFEQVDCPE